jgi:hypothetical protein
MFLKSQGLLNAGLIALALSFGAVSAHAEQSTFNLPVEAHWGAVLLQPGHYELKVSSAPFLPHFMSVIQDGHTKLILPSVEEVVETSGQDYLRLVIVGNDYYIREYNSGSKGKRFTFLMPKRPYYEVKAIPPRIPVSEKQGS